MVLTERDEGPFYFRGRAYVRRPEPMHFPSEGPLPWEGPQPVPETGRHLLLRTALFLALRHAFQERALVTSEQFVYWDPTDCTQCLAPDVAVRLGGPSEPIDVWKAWELGAPHVALEIASNHDRSKAERDRKLQRYRRAGVQEVVWFDPEDSAVALRLFDLLDGDLVERDSTVPEARRSATLGLYWTVNDDPILGRTLGAAWDATGLSPLPTPEEAERQEKEIERRAKEIERQAKETERQAKEMEREAKEAALRRIRELEAELARK